MSDKLTAVLHKLMTYLSYRDSLLDTHSDNSLTLGLKLQPAKSNCCTSTDVSTIKSKICAFTSENFLCALTELPCAHVSEIIIPVQLCVWWAHHWSIHAPPSLPSMCHLTQRTELLHQASLSVNDANCSQTNGISILMYIFMMSNCVLFYQLQSFAILETKWLLSLVLVAPPRFGTNWLPTASDVGPWRETC